MLGVRSLRSDQDLVGCRLVLTRQPEDNSVIPRLADNLETYRETASIEPAWSADGWQSEVVGEHGVRWRQSLGICRSVFHAQQRRRSRRQQQDVDDCECATVDRLPILLDCTQVTKPRHVKRRTGLDDFVAERPQRLDRRPERAGYLGVCVEIVGDADPDLSLLQHVAMEIVSLLREYAQDDSGIVRASRRKSRMR
jgi:hypothetical protein